MKIILIDAVHTFVSDKGKVDKEVLNVLESYPNRKIIVTNAPYEKFEDYKLYNMPYDVFTLQKTPPKTDPTYFEVLIDKCHSKPRNFVYIEHNKEAVEVAKSLGIKSHHFDKDKRDIKALKQFLNDNIH